MADPAFRPDANALARAFRMVERTLTETPVPRPSASELDLPRNLPEEGVGEDEALTAVGDLFLRGASILSHPGFFAHMDPPTPNITWDGSTLTPAPHRATARRSDANRWTDGNQMLTQNPLFQQIASTRWTQGAMSWMLQLAT